MGVIINGGINIGSGRILINNPSPFIRTIPYKFGTADLVFDFLSTGNYSNSGTSIADLSGNGNDGIFTQGTGNGSPFTVTGYNTNGYLRLLGLSNELSVRLPDVLKRTGTDQFTYIAYMRPRGYSFNGNFPGIISNQGFNEVEFLGLTWGISPINTPPGGQFSARNNTDGNNFAYQGGAGLNVWSVYAIKFNGTSTTLYQYYNGVLYSQNVVGATALVSLPDWGLFLGLRYNNWINADFNYVAMYNTALPDNDILTIARTLISITPI
jgi:hypothetical protein